MRDMDMRLKPLGKRIIAHSPAAAPAAGSTASIARLVVRVKELKLQNGDVSLGAIAIDTQIVVERVVAWAADREQLAAAAAVANRQRVVAGAHENGRVLV